MTEAKRMLEEILSREPKNAMALHLLGIVKYKEGEARQAIELFGKAIASRPDYAEAHNDLGNVLREQGKMEEAVAAYHRALELKPEYAMARSNLGNALKDQGRLEEAVAAYRRAVELKPDYAEAHNNLGAALKDQGKLEEAVAACHRALELNPDLANAHNNLGIALKDQGKLEEAMAAYRRTLELKPDLALAHSNLIFIMNYDVRFSQKDIFAESRRWDEIHAAPYREHERTHANDRDPDRRLRVGYVSPDFRDHSVAYFADALIAGHDRRSFEVFCYAQVIKPDAKTARFHDLADVWRSTVGITHATVAERIQEDGIDILVDLAGHTGENRLPVFAARPAPVQVSWLGYPNTTGLSAMDYRLTDAIADPDRAEDTLYSETLVRLPNGFLCFTPAGGAPDIGGSPALANGRVTFGSFNNLTKVVLEAVKTWARILERVPGSRLLLKSRPLADAPDIGGSPALASGHVTFGSFNNLTKVVPEVVETWARILERVPGSRLLLKSRPLADAATRDRYLDMFATHRIDAGRVELRPWIASKSGHLGVYDQVDIGLDPFPYNGTTTTCEALWMGVPVVTLRGERHSGRVGASILSRIGLTDLIAETRDAYVETAVGLAKAPDRLSGFRKNLRHRTQESPLCDGDAFTRDVEAVYREMWRHWCRGDRSQAGVIEAGRSGH